MSSGEIAQEAFSVWERRPSAHPLMAVQDVAERLGVGDRYVRRLIAEHRLPYFKVGAKVRVAREDLDAYLAACRREVPVVVEPEDLARELGLRLEQA